MKLEAVLQPYINQIDEELKRFLNRPKPKGLYEAVRHMPMAGGKRLRPVVAILSTQCVGGDINRVMPFAIALELLHSYSLVHDDIIDKDDLRRGAETVHTKFGTSTAILAGDTLQGLCYESLARLEVDPVMWKEVVTDVTKLAVEIAEGQYYDVEFESVRKVGEMDYYHMIERKTATMFEMAAKLGARIGGGEHGHVKKLAEAGRLMGLAFQVWDDYLDVMADEKDLGKRIGSDILNGKKTLVIVNALESLDPFDRRKLYDLISAKDRSPENLEEIMKYLKKSGALEHAKRRAQEFTSHAKSCLAALPETSARNLLGEIVGFMATRHY